nr:alpha-amylase family glycosyl hydrolase [uncultured Undibacterium sp.]
MTTTSLRLYRPLIFTLITLLSACGGGSSGSSTSSPIIFSSTSTPTVEVPSTILPMVNVSAVSKNDPGSPLSDNWRNGPFMEIYVRGYQDSNGDGVGDIRGLIQRLDYLQDLGIKGIWLMPITQSEDKDHGYAVKDYRDIETQYGTLADFDELIKQAHARGIGLILDYVMNHSANTHPAFINAADTSTNAYRAWYVWKDIAPGGWNVFGNNPWYNTKNGAYFAAFYSGMPDFNLLNPAVLEFHQNNLRFWLNRGADGFRFDAVGNLVENNAGAWESQPESIALMGKVQENIAQYSKRFMVCEAPGNPLAFAASNSCGNAFAFKHNYDIANAAKGQLSAIQAVVDYFNTAPLTMSTMISNHDEFAGARLWDQLNGNLAQYKLAAATYLLQPGTPFIYYGEEIGLAGAANLTGDHKLRTPMSWNSNSNNAGFTTGTPFRALSGNASSQNVEAQRLDPNSLLQFYKDLISLRNQRSSLNSGNYSNAAVSGNVLSFQRQSGDEKSVVLINYGNNSITTSLKNLPINTTLSSVYPNKIVKVNSDTVGSADVNLPAQSIFVFSFN